MIPKRLNIICLTVFFTFLGVIGLLALLGGKPVYASPGVFYVAPAGNCGSASPCYSSVQAAVDAAQPGDEIRVAAGTYSGVNNQGGLSQMVYLNKSLTIRGGFTTSNWNTPDPDNNATELNAITLGRVMYITGVDTVVTLAGLRLIYGNAEGFGDRGGGVYINQADVTILRSWIAHGATSHNGYGGGLYMQDGILEMKQTVLEENEGGHGGGAFIQDSQALVHSNSVFRSNRATSSQNTASAIRVEESNFTLRESQLFNNEGATATSIADSQVLMDSNIISGTKAGGVSFFGGNGDVSQNLITANESFGLSITNGVFVVRGNEISYNQGGGGTDDPGVVIDGMTGMLIGNFIHHNQNTYSACHGGGVNVNASGDGWVTLVGNIIRDNSAGEQVGLPSHGYGGGVYLKGDNITLERNLIQNNTAVGFIWAGSQYWGGYGGGVFINDDVTLINNIITGNSGRWHGSGIYISGASPTLSHNTLAQNIWVGDDGTGILVEEDGSTKEKSQPKLYNNIIVSQTVGISASGDEVENIVIADGILWSGNLSNTIGTGTFFLSNEFTGSPMFVDPAGDDYHITARSAAIDKGIDASVLTDFDSETRLGAPDLGADEYWAPDALKRIYLPLVIR